MYEYVNSMGTELKYYVSIPECQIERTGLIFTCTLVGVCKDFEKNRTAPLWKVCNNSVVLKSLTYNNCVFYLMSVLGIYGCCLTIPLQG